MGEMLLKVVLAALLGGIVGMERELAHKEAGLRTMILIAMGSSLITILSFAFPAISGGGDPARLAAQIVTGIGFLGAGAIIQARMAVHGLTTAASIWTVSAIGIAVGCGYYLFSLLVTLLVLLVLAVFRMLAVFLEKQKQVFVYQIAFADRTATFFDIKKVLTELNIQPSQSKLSKSRNGYELELIFSTSPNKGREFVEKVIHLQGVNELLSESL
jgi:putative Mg2+ transporter-C (MgtC) family protein